MNFTTCSTLFDSAVWWIVGTLFFHFGVAASAQNTVTGKVNAVFKQVVSGLSAQERQLIDEFRLNYEKIKDFYGNARIDALLRHSHISPAMTVENPDGRQAGRLAFRSNGNKLFRMDVEELDWKSEQPTGKLDIYVAGPDINFKAMKLGPTTGLVLTRVTQSREEMVAEFAHHTFFRGPFSIVAIPLEDLLFQQTPFENWKIDRVSPFEEDGRRFASIICSGNAKSPTSSNTKIRIEGKFVFFRDLMWAMKGYSYGSATLKSADDTSRNATFEYDGGEKDAPLLKRATYWRSAGDQQRFSVEEYTITNFIPGAVAESEFLPTAIDLTIGQTRANWWPRVVVILLGLALISAYLFLKRKASA